MSLAPDKKPAARPGFMFLGEHSAIDFANTLIPPPGPNIDFLHGWSDVIGWLVETKLSEATHLQIPTAREAEALKRVKHLRQAWRGTLNQIIAGEKISDSFLKTINVILEQDAFHEILVRSENKGFQLVRPSSQLHGEHLAVSLIAREIARFLAEANLSYLHQCANKTSCVLFFYDTTKNHVRQWCSVSTCGNRHKVAEFRRRRNQKTKTASGSRK